MTTKAKNEAPEMYVQQTQAPTANTKAQKTKRHKDSRARSIIPGCQAVHTVA